MTAPPFFRSLRGRLTALFGVLIVVSVGVTFLAIYNGTGSALRSEIDRNLRSDAQEFDRGGVPPAPRSPMQIANAARAYLAGQPFRASSRLRIIQIPGRPPVTNEPELLNTHLEPGESAEHQAEEARQARSLAAARVGYSNVRITDAGKVRLYLTPVRRGGRQVATIAVGEPLSTVEHAQREVARTFLLSGSITLALALLAAYFVASRTSRPLRRMARVAARVDAGDLSPRMAEGGTRDEVRALAESFDTMLDRLEDAFARQRAFASDASHELRTPLTVIRGQLEVLARQAEPSPADVRHVERLVRTEIVRMERLVEDLLLLARADEREFLRPRTFGLAGFASELFEGLRATADRRFELGELPAGTLVADPDRLAQALRNLLRNAVEHTAPGGLVRLAVSTRADHVTLAVEDDGPGIPPGQRQRVFDRFHRIGSARSRASGNTGLGLAIARAIVEAHGGSITAGESPEGGARVQIELPGFTSAERAEAPAEPPEVPLPSGR